MRFAGNEKSDMDPSILDNRQINLYSVVGMGSYRMRGYAQNKVEMKEILDPNVVAMCNEF